MTLVYVFAHPAILSPLKKRSKLRGITPGEIKEVISLLILEENDLEVFPKGDETVLSQGEGRVLPVDITIIFLICRTDGVGTGLESKE